MLTGFDAKGRPRGVKGAVHGLEGHGTGELLDPFQEALGNPSLARLAIRPTSVGNGLVFAPTPLAAIEVDRASIEPSRCVLAIDQGQPWITRTDVRGPTLSALRAARSRGTKPRGPGNAALPPAAPGSRRALALDKIAARARAMTRGAHSDFDRAVAIVRHFREDHTYDLFDTTFPTPEESLELFERRTGSCTHFAASASLMLRQLGMPTRIAAGYVAREATQAGEWIVRMRDGHAWIEVWFEGLGWLPFDPTPAAQGVGNPHWTPLRETSLLGDGSLAGGALFGSGTPLAGLVQRAWRSIWSESPPVPWVAALWSVGFFAFGWGLLLVWRRKKKRGRSSAIQLKSAAPKPLVHAPLALAFSRALQRHGVHPRQSETPLAFARRAETELGAPVGAIVDATGALLEAATNQRPLRAPEASRIEAARDWLESSWQGPPK